MILPYKCEHKYQDEKYGKGLRVHNWARKAQTTGAWRCTICGKEKQAAAPAETKP